MSQNLWKELDIYCNDDKIRYKHLLFFFICKLVKLFRKFFHKHSTVPLDDIAQAYLIFDFLPISWNEGLTENEQAIFESFDGAGGKLSYLPRTQ